jgi:excinuclease ABC subunit B
MTEFQLTSTFAPEGSQPEAIRQLTEGLFNNEQFQTLLGVTGSGKTFTMANVIAGGNRPTLVLAHNKTLAAQLYQEFCDFFPHNRVEYFVSYYDYYQPESYIPAKDQYIEKDSAINPKIEMLRLSATASLSFRRDVIIVASVSCIFGLGNPENFRNMGFELSVGQKITRNEILSRLIDILFERNDLELMPGRFRVKGDIIDIVPGYFNDIIRIEMFGDEIERIREVDKNTGAKKEEMKYFYVYPARHFVTPEGTRKTAIDSIRGELDEVLPTLGMIEAHRLEQRTRFDLEMIEETGSCKGIENYSRHFDGRAAGEKPYCLLDYFPDDFLMIIDESHQTIPQLHGMYNGDRSRKKALIDYGFRLPSAYDNRPLKFHEFEQYMGNVIFVSATPGDYEVKKSSRLVEQIIRPTGLVDPKVEVRPIDGQTDDVIHEVQATIKRGDRALVTTLTKKLAEELSEFLSDQGIRTRYLHSEIQTLERSEIIRELRLGKFDVRDARSLIQIIGRAARNINAHVVLYADRMTDSMKRAIAETKRRRDLQIAYNTEHHITPKTIKKPVKEKEVEIKDTKHVPRPEIPNVIIEIEKQMRDAAENLDFERAIALRDQIKKLNERLKEKGKRSIDK